MISEKIKEMDIDILEICTRISKIFSIIVQMIICLVLINIYKIPFYYCILMVFIIMMSNYMEGVFKFYLFIRKEKDE